MKVGDLIQLSAYGKKLAYYKATSIWPDGIGVLVKVSPPHYTVLWRGGRLKEAHLRGDLKLAKIKKEIQK